MSKIRLSNRAIAYVDADDLERVQNYNWHFDGRYATRNLSRGKKQYLHHFILEVEPSRSLHVDHVSGNKLDNRKCNLRLLSAIEHGQRNVVVMLEKRSVAEIWETRRARYGPSGRASA
jgi:hypothetical protein